jgi:uncharacterized protein involved in response to NO
VFSFPRIKAHRLLFPLAAAHAAVAVPLAVYAMTSGAGWPPGLVGPGHAYEMLFGFALLLVAGYLLGAVSPFTLSGLVVLWLAARSTHVLAPHSPAAAALSPLFALVLAVLVVPRFRNSKKWRNQSVMPLLLALCLLPAVYVAAARFSWTLSRHELLLAGILLLALLMAFMGGRIIAPAAGGAYYRIGINLKERVQPRIEGAIIILLAAACAALLLPFNRYVTGAAAAAGGLAVAARLYRWRLWRLPGRRDLWSLGLGYGWLALGLVLLGGLLLLKQNPVPAVHVITVGALGTLSVCVMTRVQLQHLRRHAERSKLVPLCAGLIAAAVAARFGADWLYDQRAALLWASAGCWSLAYILTGVRLVPGFRYASKQPMSNQPER